MPTPEIQVGRLDGRLTAVEARMERHETKTADQLSAIDAKLDAIHDTLAERAVLAKVGSRILGGIIAMATIGATLFAGIGIGK